MSSDLILSIRSKRFASRESLSGLLDQTVLVKGMDKDSKTFAACVKVDDLFRCFSSHKDETGRSLFQNPHIAGSSVARLWSGEEISDTDIHGFIDFSDLPEDQKARACYRIEWEVLQVVVDAITPHLSASVKDKILKEGLEFTKRVELVSWKPGSKVPYNIVTLSIGQPPVEFSVYCICNPPETACRMYDFNSGGLQIYPKEDGYELASTCHEDIDSHVEEIVRKELHCHKPEELERKGFVRYLSKILQAGYTDYSTELFFSLFKAGKIFSKEGSSALNADNLFIEMKQRFDPKGIGSSSYIAALFHLWFIDCKQESFQPVKQKAKQELHRIFTSSSMPIGKEIASLISKGKKSELLWVLLSLGHDVKSIQYRAEQCLQVTIDPKVLNPSDISTRALYLPLPISKFYLADIEEVYSVSRGMLMHRSFSDAKAKAALEKILSALTNVRSFPYVAKIVYKFDLKKNEEFYAYFSAWFSGSSESVRSSVALDIYHSALSANSSSLLLSVKDKLSLIKILSKKLDTLEALLAWDRRELQGKVYLLAYEIFYSTEYKKLDPEDQNLLLSLIKTENFKIFSPSLTPAQKYAANPQRVEANLKAIHSLYTTGNTSLGIATRALSFAVECGLSDIAMEFTETFFRENKLLDSSVREAVISCSVAFPKNYCKTLLEDRHKGFPAQKKESLRIALGSLLQQAGFDRELAKSLILIAKEVFSKQDVADLIGAILLFSEKNDAVLSFYSDVQQLFSKYNCLPNFEQIQIKGLAFLSQQPHARKIIEENSDVAKSFVRRCLFLEQPSLAAPVLESLAAKDLDFVLDSLATPMALYRGDEKTCSLFIKIWLALHPLITEQTHLKIINLLKLHLEEIGKRFFFHPSRMSDGIHKDLKALFKHYALLTPNEKLWSRLQLMTGTVVSSEKRMLHDWLLMPDKEFFKPSSVLIEAICTSYFFDSDSAVQWIEFVFSYEELSEEQRQSLFFAIAARMVFGDSSCFSTSTDQRERLASKVFADFPVLQVENMDQYKRQIFDKAYFCMVHGNKETREAVLDALVKESDVLTTRIPKGEIRPCLQSEPAVFFVAYLRALQSKDVDHILKVMKNPLTRKWIAQGHSHLLFKEISKEIAPFLDSVLPSKKNPHSKGREHVPDLVGHLLQFILFQNEWSTKLLEGRKSSLPEFVIDEIHEVQETVKSVLENIIHQIKQKKSIITLAALSDHWFAISAFISTKELEKLEELVVDASIECMQEMREAPETNEQMLQSLKQVCKNLLYPYVSKAVSEDKRLRLISQLIPLLAKSHNKVSPDDFQSLLYTFTSILSRFSKESLEKFYLTFMEKIVRTEGTVSFLEYGLICDLTSYCSTTKKVLAEGVCHNLFRDLRFLNSSCNVKHYHLILAFIRKMAIDTEFLSDKDLEKAENYIHFQIIILHEAMENAGLRDEEFRAYQKDLFEVLTTYIEKHRPSNFLSSLQAAMYVSFFYKSPSGAMQRYPSSSYNEKETCKLLPKILSHFVTLDFSDKGVLAISIAVQDLYGAWKAQFDRHLSEEEKSIVEAFFYHFRGLKSAFAVEALLDEISGDTSS